MVCNIVVIGKESHLKHLRPALDAFGKGVKYMASSRSIEAVQQCHELGKVDLAFVEHGWTAGREEFSEGVKKLFKDKFNTTPIVCFGSPKSGGKQGQDYHYTMDDVEPSVVTDYVKKAIAGQLSVTGKPPPRKSVDEAPPAGRKSVDNGEGNGLSRSKSLARAPSMARSASIRQKSSAADSDELDPPFPGWGNRASMRRGQYDQEDYQTGMPSMMPAPSMRRQSIEQNEAYGAAMGVPPMLGSMPSMRRQSMDRGAFDGMGGMPGMGMGMGAMGVPPMLAPMPSMRRQSIDPNEAYGAPMMAVPTPSPLMIASNALMAASALAAVAPAPAPPPAAPAPGALQPEANVGGELVKLLSEEVVRLRKAVDEKRRASLEQPSGLAAQLQGLVV